MKKMISKVTSLFPVNDMNREVDLSACFHDYQKNDLDSANGSRRMACPLCHTPLNERVKPEEVFFELCSSCGLIWVDQFVPRVQGLLGVRASGRTASCEGVYPPACDSRNPRHRPEAV